MDKKSVMNNNNRRIVCLNRRKSNTTDLLKDRPTKNPEISCVSPFNVTYLP
jgi:hypothetical protein